MSYSEKILFEQRITNEVFVPDGRNSGAIIRAVRAEVFNLGDVRTGVCGDVDTVPDPTNVVVIRGAWSLCAAGRKFSGKCIYFYFKLKIPGKCDTPKIKV